MKKVRLFICCFMLAALLLPLSSCGVQDRPSETAPSTALETDLQTAASAPTLESVPIPVTGDERSETATATEPDGTPTPQSEDPSKQSERAETLSRLKRYKEESDSLTKAAVSYAVVSYFGRHYPAIISGVYECFQCDVDSGAYITESNAQRIKECEGCSLDDVVDLLPQPLLTYYTRYTTKDFPLVPAEASESMVRPSAPILVPMVFEVKTLSLTEDGKILEITFAQEYENDQPGTAAEVMPKGFVIKTVNEYAFDEIVQLYK